MTNRFARLYQKLRDRLGGRAKLAFAIVAIWIAVEIIAAVTVAVLGADWLTSSGSVAKSGSGSLALTMGAPRSSPSIAVL